MGRDKDVHLQIKQWFISEWQIQQEVFPEEQSSRQEKQRQAGWQRWSTETVDKNARRGLGAAGKRSLWCRKRECCLLSIQCSSVQQRWGSMGITQIECSAITHFNQEVSPPRGGAGAAHHGAWLPVLADSWVASSFHWHLAGWRDAG